MASLEIDHAGILKERICEEFTVDHSYENDLEIRKVVMREDFKDTALLKVQRLSIGEANSRATKVILLVGATGGGKTTLINAMVNYIFGIDFADPYRFILVDDENAPKKSPAESQTDLITAYAFNHLPGMPFEYNYVLIDTPGFGDTRGILRDQELMEQMKAFFENDYGVIQVDCIGMVVPAVDQRLTATQRYVFNGLTNMFGKDVRDNIFVMSTFCDDGRPLVKDALKEAKVPYKGMYKFNNSALFAKNSACDPDININEHNWAMGRKSMSDFFYKLGMTFPVSLQLTKEVLKSRSLIQSCLSAIEALVHIGLDKMITLEKEKAMLVNIEDDLKNCENYEREIEVPKIKTLQPQGAKSHYSMRMSVDVMTIVQSLVAIVTQGVKGLAKVFGSLFGSGGNKPQPMQLEFNYKNEEPSPDLALQDFGYEYVKEKRTIKELMVRYSEAMKNKVDKEQIVKAIEEDIKRFSTHLLQLIAQAQAHEQLLRNIALKQDSISTKEYIDLMIQNERSQRNLHWEKRVEMLMQLQKDAEALGVGPGAERKTVQDDFIDQVIGFGDLWK